MGLKAGVGCPTPLRNAGVTGKLGRARTHHKVDSQGARYLEISRVA